MLALITRTQSTAMAESEAPSVARGEWCGGINPSDRRSGKLVPVSGTE